MSALLEKIGQMAVFLICAQTLMHFRPKDSYEKYIKLLVSMMLLILLVEPVMDLFGKGNTGDFMEQVEIYEQSLQDILGSPQLEAAQIEGILESITMQKVEEGAVYLQKEQMQTTEGAVMQGGEPDLIEVSVEAAGNIKEDDMLKEVLLEKREEVKEGKALPEAEVEKIIEVQVEVEEVQNVEIGAGYGKSANNY